MAEFPLRSIIREEAFEDELHVLIRDAERADEYTAGAEYVLARDPRAGMMLQAGSPEIWSLPMAPVEGKTIWLLYSFDEEAVIFLGLRMM